MEYRKFEIWHDENKQGGYYHGVLMIPVDKKLEIIKYLKSIRDEHGIPYEQDLKFAGSLNSELKGRIILNQLQLFSHCLITKEGNKTSFFHLNGKMRYTKEYQPFLEIDEIIGARFGLLKVADNMKSFPQNTYSQNIETTFNYVLRGCCHGMFSLENPIEICSLNFDGNEHHSGGINLSNLIKGNIRPYCKISENVSIDDRQISERDPDTKLLINFVDNIIGAWRALLDGEKDENRVLCPLYEMYERLKNNLIFKNKNSRWYKSISLSEYLIENNIVSYPDIFRNPNQQNLGF